MSIEPINNKRLVGHELYNSLEKAKSDSKAHSMNMKVEPDIAAFTRASGVSAQEDIKKSTVT